MKQYFHELTIDEYNQLKASGATWEDVEDTYDQPAWCNYPDALAGIMGCWSLIELSVKDKSYCCACEYCDK
jgi:hypothetical protein